MQTLHQFHQQVKPLHNFKLSVSNPGVTSVRSIQKVRPECAGAYVNYA